ncbi:hypothetical protein BN975_00131 [Mycolicibacterium farcinogenes]|nr:hypothetical protein BN975_00131 [Mycolicibacterium farcinogenes]
MRDVLEVVVACGAGSSIGARFGAGTVGAVDGLGQQGVDLVEGQNGRAGQRDQPRDVAHRFLRSEYRRGQAPGFFLTVAGQEGLADVLQLEVAGTEQDQGTQGVVGAFDGVAVHLVQ